MSVAILYTSRYGYTESVARTVAERLSAQNPELLDAHRWTSVPRDANTVVVGAPIYGGTIAGGIVGCLELNVDLLLERRLFFFLSCLNEGDKAERQLADSIPPALLAHASGRFFVGGLVNFDVLRWMDRQVMQRVAGVTESVDRTRPDQVEALVQAILAE